MAVIPILILLVAQDGMSGELFQRVRVREKGQGVEEGIRKEPGTEWLLLFWYTGESKQKASTLLRTRTEDPSYLNLNPLCLYQIRNLKSIASDRPEVLLLV